MLPPKRALEIEDFNVTEAQDAIEALERVRSEQIVAYAPVRWRDQLWSVAISVPASEINHLIQSVYTKQMVFLGTVIAIIMGGSPGLIVIFSRWNKTLEAEVKSKTADLSRTNKELAQAN